jgi:hypothetical protein
MDTDKSILKKVKSMDNNQPSQIVSEIANWCLDQPYKQFNIEKENDRLCELADNFFEQKTLDDMIDAYSEFIFQWIAIQSWMYVNQDESDLSDLSYRIMADYSTMSERVIDVMCSMIKIKIKEADRSVDDAIELINKTLGELLEFRKADPSG